MKTYTYSQARGKIGSTSLKNLKKRKLLFVAGKGDIFSIVPKAPVPSLTI